MRFIAPIAMSSTIDGVGLVTTDSLKLARQAREKSFRARQKTESDSRKQKHKLEAFATRKQIPVGPPKIPAAPKRQRIKKLTPDERAHERARFSACWTNEQIDYLRESSENLEPSQTPGNLFVRNLRKFFNVLPDAVNPGANNTYAAPPSFSSQSEGEADSSSDSDSMELVTPRALTPDHEIEALLNAEPEEHFKYVPHSPKHKFTRPELGQFWEKSKQESLHRRYGLYREAMTKLGKAVPTPPDFDAMKAWERSVSEWEYKKCNVARHCFLVLQKHPHYARKMEQKAWEDYQEREQERMAQVADGLIRDHQAKEKAYVEQLRRREMERNQQRQLPTLEASGDLLQRDSFTSEFEVEAMLASQLTLTQSRFSVAQVQNREDEDRTSEQSVESVLFRRLSRQQTIRLAAAQPQPAPQPPAYPLKPEPSFVSRILCYDNAFQRLPWSRTCKLTFLTVPWPVLSAPASVEDITPSAILSFLETAVALYIPPPTLGTSFVSEFSYTDSEREQALLTAQMAREEAAQAGYGEQSEEERVFGHVMEIALGECEHWSPEFVRESVLPHVMWGDVERSLVVEGSKIVYATLCELAEGRVPV